jgi:hypothetical protein
MSIPSPISCFRAKRGSRTINIWLILKFNASLRGYAYACFGESMGMTMVIPVVMGSQLPGNMSRRQQEAQNQETASSAASEPDPNALQKSMGLKSGSRGGLALGAKIKADLSTVPTAEEPTGENVLVSPAVYDNSEGRNGFFSGSSQTEVATDLTAFLFRKRFGDTGAAPNAAVVISKIASAAQDEIQRIDSRKDRDRSGREGSKSSEVDQPSSGGASDGGSDGASASTRTSAAKPLRMESTMAMIIDSFISKQDTVAA